MCHMHELYTERRLLRFRSNGAAATWCTTCVDFLRVERISLRTLVLVSLLVVSSSPGSLVDRPSVSRSRSFAANCIDPVRRLEPFGVLCISRVEEELLLSRFRLDALFFGVPAVKETVVSSDDTESLPRKYKNYGFHKSMIPFPFANLDDEWAGIFSFSGEAGSTLLLTDDALPFSGCTDIVSVFVPLLCARLAARSNLRILSMVMLSEYYSLALRGVGGHCTIVRVSSGTAPPSVAATHG